MDTENKEEVKVETKKKGNGLFTLFACVMTGVIVFLAMNVGKKAGKAVDPEVNTNKESNITSNVESNSNVTSNVESNSNVTSNVTSNTKVDVTLKEDAVDAKGMVGAKVIATINGAKAWEYTTGKYTESELNTFTL